MVIKLENINKTYGAKKIFNNATLSISKHERVGIIGKNGCGKSTLLKIICGIDTVDDGTVLINNTLSFNYLPQSVEVSGDLNIRDVVFNELPYIEEYEIAAILNKFGIEDIEKSYGLLSGGEKRKVTLAISILSDKDVLLLDEPTNHLDQNMIKWLENHIAKMRKTVIVISHDRYFLDNICTKIVDIDQAKLHKYDGNYTTAIEMRNIRLGDKLANDRKIKSKLRREQIWMNQGAKARETKSKERMEKFHELKEHDFYQKDAEIITDNISSRLGSKTIILENVSFSIEDRVLLNNFSYNFQKFDRIGILGRNGVGKTTFLNLITDTIKPTSGTIECGDTVKIAYFTQENIVLNDNLKVIDFIKDIAEYITTSTGTISASKLLENFLFPPNVQHGYIRTLSGGEKRRLYLLSLLVKQPNVLVLDEPTNDFDVITLEVLESLLLEFEGIIITVSHDRYFLKTITNKLFVLPGAGDVNIVNDLYENYLDQPETKVKEVPKVVVAPVVEKVKPKVKMSFKEKYDWENIEAEIATLEEELAKIDVEISANPDFDTLNTLIEKRSKVEENYNERVARWEYLFELDATINE